MMMMTMKIMIWEIWSLEKEKEKLRSGTWNPQRVLNLIQNHPILIQRLALKTTIKELIAFSSLAYRTIQLQK